MSFNFKYVFEKMVYEASASPMSEEEGKKLFTISIIDKQHAKKYGEIMTATEAEKDKNNWNITHVPTNYDGEFYKAVQVWFNTYMKKLN